MYHNEIQLHYAIERRPKLLQTSVIMYSRYFNYRQTCNISHTLVGNKIVGLSDVVGASLVGAAPTTSIFST